MPGGNVNEARPSERIPCPFDLALQTFTTVDAATGRDWLEPSLVLEDDLLVLEFKHRSSLGKQVDRKGLNWRGCLRFHRTSDQRNLEARELGGAAGAPESRSTLRMFQLRRLAAAPSFWVSAWAPA